MLRDYDEEFHQITLHELFEAKDGKPNLFAVSKIFTEARKQMSAVEYKTFYLALSKIRWKEECPEVLYLDKKELAAMLGFESDTDHLSENLNRAIGDMPVHSSIKFSDKEKGIYDNGVFIRRITILRNRVRILMEPEYLSLFGQLEKNFVMELVSDIAKMRTERSIVFYELLLQNTDSRETINHAEIGIRKLKEIFDIPKEGAGSYVTKDGHFERTRFEQRVIDPICEDLSKTERIQLAIQPNGKLYEKVKHGNRVVAYRFSWYSTQRPGIASAPEVKLLQEKVDADPQVMKVAKDIIAGKENPKKKEKKKKSRADQTDFMHHENMDAELDWIEVLSYKGMSREAQEKAMEARGYVRDETGKWKKEK